MKINVTVDSGKVGVFSGESGKTSVTIKLDDFQHEADALVELTGAATVAATTIIDTIRDAEEGADEPSEAGPTHVVNVYSAENGPTEKES